MIKISAVLLLTAVASFGQAKSIPPGSKIYVDADGSFSTYLSAALQKKKVPVTVVANSEKADYVLSGTSQHEEKSWASKVFLSHRDTTEASVKLVHVKSSEVVWAYNVHKKNSARGHQSTAEACAKHFKEVVK